METILITGGTGLVGTHLRKILRDNGYRVVVFSSRDKRNVTADSYFWDINKGIINTEMVLHADYIIHLAGAGISAKRWTKARKQEITDSRVKSVHLIYKTIKENKHQLKAFITASATGYYGSISTNKVFDETNLSANDFTGNVCHKWESAAANFEKLGVRTVKIRTGIVLSPQGGALSKMAAPVKLGLGAALGTGKQYIPWIHIDDLCRIYLKAVNDEMLFGAINAVAPEYVSNKLFMKTLAISLRKPFWLPAIPAFILKAIFGEMASILLNGSRVSPDKIMQSGYHFLFPSLKKALADIFPKSY
ncbi:MAG: TIGR01777 family oxidoreductase [Bacteroidales bacterium]|nr:TIGR01777 family oxidoreductase [Bacteroidales bacterium]